MTYPCEQPLCPSSPLPDAPAREEAHPGADDAPSAPGGPPRNRIRVAVDDFDEAEVLDLLTGTEEEIGRAVVLIDRHLRVRLCRWLGRRFPRMSEDDLADAWGGTILGVLRAARGRRFRSDEGLFPWLCQIVRSRGIDDLRRRLAREAVLVALPPGGLDVPARGRPVPEQAGAGELVPWLRRFIATFPGRQRAVMRAYVDRYPDSACLVVLRREASRLAGAELTRASVKRALEEGRRKLRAFLLGKGHTACAAA